MTMKEKNKGKMMKCGHTAHAVDMNTGDWHCIICWPSVDAVTPAAEEDIPDLSDREAQCPYCKEITDSRFTLPFFKYKGPGSWSAENMCGRCGYTKDAHTRKDMGHEFEARGSYEFDEYYDGCFGWN